MPPLFYWFPFVANALLSFGYKLNYHRCECIGNIVHTQGLVLSSKGPGMSPLQLRGGDSKLPEVPAPSRTESRCSPLTSQPIMYSPLPSYKGPVRTKHSYKAMGVQGSVC